MSTYTQIYYHIVFSTKERSPVLSADRRKELFRYTWGILKNKESHLYRINGVEDHIGYSAFTISHDDKDAVIEYIKNQPEHHKKISFRDELRQLLEKFGVQFDEKYLA